MRIAITGGGGFVGGHLTAQLRGLGHEVTAVARTVSPPQADVLIHAGWDLANPEANVESSIRLFRTAAPFIPRILFISSLSAFEGCLSRYGSAKLAVEKAASAIGGCSVRLGFVCDDSNRGLSGALKKLAALPVIPLPGGGQQRLFTIRAEDLAPAFLEILEHCGREPVNLAHPEPVSLERMMRTFAARNGKDPIFLPFPWRLLWAPLRVAEAAGLRLAFRSDSLVSLMDQNPAPDFRPLGEWDVILRAFQANSGTINDTL